jgi:hypothetical protein
MRIEHARDGNHGLKATLYDGEHQIGYIRHGTVGFHGFDTSSAAAEAAHIAHRALSERRSRATWVSDTPEDFLVWDHPVGPYVIARSGLLARLTAPGPDTAGGWGFAVSLRPEETAKVFAMSRARTMWRALRWTGQTRRMRQFHDDPVASGDLSVAQRAPV